MNIIALLLNQGSAMGGFSGFWAGFRVALRVPGPGENPDINYIFLHLNKILLKIWSSFWKGKKVFLVLNFGRCEAVLRVFSVIGGRGDFSAACGRPMTIDNGKNEKHKKLHVTLLPTFSSMFSAKNNIFIRCVFKNQSDFDEIIINYINIKSHDFGTWTQRSASLKIWPVPSTHRYPKFFFWSLMPTPGRYSETVYHKLDFSAYGLHIDYPPAWKLNKLLKLF